MKTYLVDKECDWRRIAVESIEVLAGGFGSRMDAAPPVPVNEKRRLPHDKWLLSSALQKLVRFGAVQEAIEVALRLHRLHPNYLPRRLPIVALEDVGIADVALCVDVLTACGSSRYAGDRSLANQEYTLAVLVRRLCSATKSRVACDLLCLAQSYEGADGYLSDLRIRKPSEWVAVATDPHDDVIRRLVALRLMSGITIRAGASYVTVSRSSVDELVRTAALLETPESVQWLVERTRRTEHIAATLPIVWEVCNPGNVTVGCDRLFPASHDLIAGVPAAAFDQHSAIGRQAISLFWQRSHRLQRFVQAHAKPATALRLIGMAIFWSESVKCAERLVSPEIDAITRMAEEQEMRELGLCDVSRTHELFELLREEHHVLLDARHTIASDRLEMQGC